MVREKEGLLEKSRKFLSGNKGFSPQTTGSGQDTGTDSMSSEKTRYQRRRDQVRRAQRSHRERKENYIKSLEQEILELRTNPASRVRSLEAQIAYLKQALARSGVQLPQDWQDEALKAYGNAPNAVAWFSKQPGSLQIATPVPTQQAAFQQHNALAQPLSPNLQGTNYALSEPAAAFFDKDPLRFDDDNFDVSSYLNTSQSPEATAPQNMQPQASAQARRNELLNAGIEFVLILERGCMGHFHAVVPTPNQETTGHGLLASHHLLAYAPQGVNTDTNWQVPQATLENLLSLSTQFDLGGEMTPVQAWHKLKNHPRFFELTSAQIISLAEQLVAEAECFGFGAVVESSSFDATIDSLFEQS